MDRYGTTLGTRVCGYVAGYAYCTYSVTAETGMDMAIGSAQGTGQEREELGRQDIAEGNS